ncbi:MAG TPA: DUF1499 domain-containing protein [Balneolales bacterium]|nr:DUF1499 domain-containing protein [Balneolales bacterium]
MENDNSENNGWQNKQYSYSIIAIISFIVGIIAVVVFTVSGFGYRANIWGLGPAFKLLKWGAYIGFFGVLVGIIGVYFSRPSKNIKGLSYSVIGLLLSIAVSGTALFFYHRATSVPPIHDISTDTVNPPQFEAVLPMRAHWPNKSTYAGPKTAALQHRFYPDIKPVMLPVQPGVAYHRSLEAAKEMSWWKIQAADSLTGHIEATSTIPWFGFKDDVVIRIDTTAEGSRVDVRSTSRIGVSDIGENARRIRSYVARLKAVSR